MSARHAACLLLAVCAACGPPKEQLRPAAKCQLAALPLGPLRAEGRSFVDAQGRTVVLRGLNTGGRSKFDPYMPFDFSPPDFDGALARYLDGAASLGVNVLRVPFIWAAVEPTQDTLNEQFLARYDALLDGAAARGLFTIVDFHQDLFAEELCGDGFPTWTLASPGPRHHDCAGWFVHYGQDQAVKTAFDDFWSNKTGTRTRYLKLWDTMAARHARRLGVIGFEVFNEPSAGSQSPATWAPDVLRPFYEEVGARVRAAAPQALVFVDTTGFDALQAETALTRPALDQLVFAPHYYDPTVLISDGPVDTDVAAALKRWAAVGKAWNVPVYLGEFGVQPDRDGAAGYVRSHYDTFDRLGMSGSYWEYSTAAEQWNAEALSIAGADGGFFPVVADEIARPFPSRVAGTLATFSFKSGAARLDYTASAGGLTEVMLPARGFAKLDPAKVQTTGGVCIDVHPGRLLIRADAAGATTVTFGTP